MSRRSPRVLVAMLVAMAPAPMAQAAEPGTCAPATPPYPPKPALPFDQDSRLSDGDFHLVGDTAELVVTGLDGNLEYCAILESTPVNLGPATTNQFGVVMNDHGWSPRSNPSFSSGTRQ